MTNAKSMVTWLILSHDYTENIVINLKFRRYHSQQCVYCKYNSRLSLGSLLSDDLALILVIIVNIMLL